MNSFTSMTTSLKFFIQPPYTRCSITLVTQLLSVSSECVVFFFVFTANEWNIVSPESQPELSLSSSLLYYSHHTPVLSVLLGSLINTKARSARHDTNEHRRETKPLERMRRQILPQLKLCRYVIFNLGKERRECFTFNVTNYQEGNFHIRWISVVILYIHEIAMILRGREREDYVSARILQETLSSSSRQASHKFLNVEFDS